MQLITVALFVAVFLLVSNLSGPLSAYLDPGTGSMVIQLVLGGIVGALALVRLYWRRVKGFVLRRQDDSHAPFTD
jgi:membrane associated rhomboid family serine protease